ncbi:hypothetical protein Scep_010297 [Stephania cephalantha]|uniref:Uncharacterized protein n=1 Tax=Stephania cephalantha TaxID=152367 RepID=A0AAP0JUS0_9MAGN
MGEIVQIEKIISTCRDIPRQTYLQTLSIIALLKTNNVVTSLVVTRLVICDHDPSWVQTFPVDTYVPYGLGYCNDPTILTCATCHFRTVTQTWSNLASSDNPRESTPSLLETTKLRFHVNKFNTQKKIQVLGTTNHSSLSIGFPLLTRVSEDQVSQEGDSRVWWLTRNWSNTLSGDQATGSGTTPAAAAVRRADGSDSSSSSSKQQRRRPQAERATDDRSQQQPATRRKLVDRRARSAADDGQGARRGSSRARRWRQAVARCERRGARAATATAAAAQQRGGSARGRDGGRRGGTAARGGGRRGRDGATVSPAARGDAHGGVRRSSRRGDDGNNSAAKRHEGVVGPIGGVNRRMLTTRLRLYAGNRSERKWVRLKKGSWGYGNQVKGSGAFTERILGFDVQFSVTGRSTRPHQEAMMTPDA